MLSWALLIGPPLVLPPLVMITEPLRVTTDDLAYCTALHQRVIARLADLPSRARDLAEDGRTLCAEGHLRTGIATLRRALRLGRTGVR